MNWELVAIIIIIVIVFIISLVYLIDDAAKNIKIIEENTIKKMSAEQLREFIAEKLEVKPSQIKFRINEGSFCGIRIMKYNEE